MSIDRIINLACFTNDWTSFLQDTICWLEEGANILYFCMDLLRLFFKIFALFQILQRYVSTYVQILICMRKKVCPISIYAHLQSNTDPFIWHKAMWSFGFCSVTNLITFSLASHDIFVYKTLETFQKLEGFRTNLFPV